MRRRRNWKRGGGELGESIVSGSRFDLSEHPVESGAVEVAAIEDNGANLARHGGQAGGRLQTHRFVIPSLPRDLIVLWVAAMKPRFIAGFFLASSKPSGCAGFSESARFLVAL